MARGEKNICALCGSLKQIPMTVDHQTREGNIICDSTPHSQNSWGAQKSLNAFSIQHSYLIWECSSNAVDKSVVFDTRKEITVSELYNLYKRLQWNEQEKLLCMLSKTQKNKIMTVSHTESVT